MYYNQTRRTLCYCILFFNFFYYLNPALSQPFKALWHFHYLMEDYTMSETIVQPQTPPLSEIKVFEKPLVEQHLFARALLFTYHPGGGSFPKSYPLRLDEKANWVVSPGLSIGYDRSVHELKWLPTWLRKRTSVRAAAAYYKDCAFFDAGYLHIGARLDLLRLGRHSLHFAGGPTFLFRGNWNQIEGYRGGDFYDDRVYKNWQYRFFPIGGEFEYLFRLKKGVAIQYNLVPAYPTLLVSKLGIRWKIGQQN